MTLSQRTIVILSFILFVATLLWGGYALIIYLGIPVHQLVYSSQAEVQTMDLACGNAPTLGMFFCRGSAVIVPFVMSFFKMASPFFAYAIICALIYGGLLLYSGYRSGYFRLSFRMKPIAVIGCFAFSVWLIGTTLSLGSLNNLQTPDNAMLQDQNGNKMLPPFRRFYEPVPQVYNVDPSSQALVQLKANYDELKSHGCLAEAGMTQNGAHVYDMSEWCVQVAMFQRVGAQFVLVLFLLLNLLVLGRFILTKIVRARDVPLLLECCFSLALGALGWVAILWMLAVWGILHAPVAWVFFLGLPLLLFFETKYWLQRSWESSIAVDWNAKSLFPILAWLLLSYIALNFLNVVRPFPIGWDDLGSYLNRPRLLASYGSFISSMSQFQWEYLTSLGFVLFGFDSWVGSTFAMQINWMAGLIAAFSVYVFGRRFMGERRGLVAAMCYYFLPMTGHFSFADMKIDNASFFTSALMILAVSTVFFRPEDEDQQVHTINWKLLLVAGLIAGFGFAIKPTAILAILMALSVMAGATLGGFGFAGMAIAGFGILQFFGALSITGVLERAGMTASTSSSIISGIFFVIAALLIGYATWTRSKTSLITFAKSVGFFAAGAMIAVLPWAVHNIYLVKAFSVPTMLSARDDRSPQVFYETQDIVSTYNLPSTVPVRVLPEELKLNPKDPACVSSARTEELDRYWGFDKGIGHYLTLPWRQVMNIDAFGYYVTFMPGLLMVPLLLLLPFFWNKRARWLRYIFAGSMVFLIQWAFVGNGIAWYGVGMFLGFALVLEALIAHAPDNPNRWLMGTLLTMSILVCLVNRLWQFDSQKNIFEYPLGKISAAALREVTIPDYDDIRESVVARHETLTDTPYTYRVGTFISYFIPKNREIFPLADHQLNFFNCLNQEGDHQLTLKRLKALGFNSIIFDTNTQTIEKDPNGSLHKKVENFVSFVNDTSVQLNIVVNDPGNGIAYMLLP